jgi:hypothetical protein
MCAHVHTISLCLPESARACSSKGVGSARVQLPMGPVLYANSPEAAYRIHHYLTPPPPRGLHILFKFRLHGLLLL